MKETHFTQAVDKLIERKMKALDIVIEEMLEPIGDVGSPEKLIGKPYEEWTQGDLQLLSSIYGTQEPNPLSDLIFRKAYENLMELEEA